MARNQCTVLYAVIRFGLPSLLSEMCFGSSWEANSTGESDCNDINYRFGMWDEGTSRESSNYHELRNLTETLELMASDGTL